MREQRLLERIAASESTQERSHSTRFDVLMQSILDHLTRLLNTRRGSVPSAPELGVPDITNLAGSLEAGSLQRAVDDMTHLLRRYEPRLKNPRVTYVADLGHRLTLSFSIEGSLNIDSQDVPVSVMTQVSPEGRVQLKRGHRAEYLL
ncbi:type VI secretion system baseplate subunit TssE [Paraburkholderia bonniea]|uniref:type VI secretion system baseplate subunit TssE n=1 Tax=Paraburkholderia bonniea TaxID=2152891 RepID=UPI001581047A|nr:type VI secretion system baseplate subunit TssE [Paraburkholderia bonniea]WJF89276.1 type VI secretion system baseplate subunit TssE [Paraburkholderia bonniea]WJF92592.1 type VI secretion system baseplate subunit TssE [Paraburkholderia bonniea]